jgi:hypothetical protein
MKVLAGRNLSQIPGLRPVYVEVEVVGVRQDCRAYRTSAVKLNQLAPEFGDPPFRFEVRGTRT